MKDIEQAFADIIESIHDLRIKSLKTPQPNYEYLLYQIQMQVFKVMDMLNRTQNDEPSVASEDASSTDAGNKILPHFPKQSESFSDYGKRMLDTKEENRGKTLNK